MYILHVNTQRGYFLPAPTYLFPSLHPFAPGSYSLCPLITPIELLVPLPPGLVLPAPGGHAPDSRG
jgi:hypothetical protein